MRLGIICLSRNHTSRSTIYICSYATLAIAAITILYFRRFPRSTFDNWLKFPRDSNLRRIFPHFSKRTNVSSNLILFRQIAGDSDNIKDVLTLMESHLKLPQSVKLLFDIYSVTANY